MLYMSFNCYFTAYVKVFHSKSTPVPFFLSVSQSLLVLLSPHLAIQQRVVLLCQTLYTSMK